MKTPYFHVLVVIFGILAVLIVQPVALAGGRVENQQITSQILANAGESAERKIAVYLPEGYDTSSQAYPILYLLHGAWGLGGNTSVFFGEPYHQVGGRNTNVNIDSMVDRLAENGDIQPLIVVMPNVAVRSYGWGNWIAVTEHIVDYMALEVVPFIDTQYRTISTRQGRAVAGHSNGGTGASSAAFTYPELFSLVGFYAGEFVDNVGDLLGAHNQLVHPLEFWTYLGTSDRMMGSYTTNATRILEEWGIPNVYIRDIGDHFNRIAERLEESIVHFSGKLSPPVTYVAGQGKLLETWGNIKSIR